MLELQQEENDLAQKFGNLLVDLKLAVEEVETFRGEDEGRDPPAILVQSLAEQRPSYASYMILQLKDRLLAIGWTEAMLIKIEQDYEKLRSNVNSSTSFVEEIWKLQEKSTFAFNEGWALTKGRYPALERFAGGL